MTKQKPIEVVTPPNMLKAKVGGKLPKFDQDAIARAEKALENLSCEFGAWLDEEVDKLEQAYGYAKANGLAERAGELLFRRAHDLKGLGATYEHPFVTRLADSLCKLIEEPELRATASISLVAAHVQAIKASVRDGIKRDDHPVGKALAGELESRVAEALSNAA